MKQVFVTGIGTDVGKTIASAVLTHYYQADYWKPVQTGDVKDYTFLKNHGYGTVHTSAYDLKLPASPHLAAQEEGVVIDPVAIQIPQVSPLVIEGAGGLLVPLNDADYVGDFVHRVSKVYLVVRHYLGSINHTLLSLYWLQQQGVEVEIIVSGKKHVASEQVIERVTGQVIEKYIPELADFSKDAFSAVASSWK